MRIAVDVSIQDTPYLTGVEKQQRFILRELGRLDQDNEYLLISRRPVTLPFDLPSNFQYLELSARNPTYLWRERLLPELLRQRKIDVFHSPVSAIPVIGNMAKIATVHEIPWVERNRKAESLRRWGHRMWLFLNTRYARRIIAVSERTRENILKLYPEAEEKVVVIHHGVDEVFQIDYDGPPRGEFLARYGIPDRPFLLYVGMLRRKKNLGALLNAFGMLPKKYREGTSIVLVGVRNVSASDLDTRVHSLGLGDRVFFPGYVSDEDLVSFYHCAEALVFPSMFEGFGLPPLEAMACGTPVVASSGGAIPEVTADAALLADPTQPPEFAKALEKVLGDTKVAAELRAKGLERVKKFTWRKTALAILSLYDATVAAQAAETA